MIIARHIGDSIICSLGFTSVEVVDRVLNGVSGLSSERAFDGCAPAFVGAINNDILTERWSNRNDNYTRFERLAVLAVEEAAQGLDLSGDKVLFILSTTKGNVSLLDEGCGATDPRLTLWHSARKVADFFGNSSQPLVISNACISGVSALITGSRMLVDGVYDRVVVVGCDELSRFVVAGFQSFNALSAGRCKPFDASRNGLNLGEGAAAIILESTSKELLNSGDTYIDGGAITNDANHISAPSRTAEGLTATIEQCDTHGVGFVSAHGTATPYNDAMEALALTRTGLNNIPTFSLKGYVGHTLGAAGILETIVSTHCLTRGVIPANWGFKTADTGIKINVSENQQTITTGEAFLKTISGFGGCNAALVVRRK